MSNYFRIESSPLLQRLDIEPGMSYTVHAGPQTRVACQAGSLLFTQTIGWAGGRPIQLSQDMHPGDIRSVESSGWILVQAGIEGARVRVETVQARASLLHRVAHWLFGSHRPALRA